MGSTEEHEGISISRSWFMKEGRYVVANWTTGSERGLELLAGGSFVRDEIDVFVPYQTQLEYRLATPFSHSLFIIFLLN